MKKLIPIIALLLMGAGCKLGEAQLGADPRVLVELQGGTGTSSPRGILYGNSGNIETVAIGSNLSFSGGTLSATGGAASDFPFTPTTNYGALSNATSTPLWLQNGLQVSSTLYGSANNLTLNSVGSPSINTVQNFFNLYSAGIRTGGTITNNGDGTITVSASEGLIATGPLATDPLVFYASAASSSIPIDAGLTHIGIEYNGGNPRVTTSSADDWTYQDDFPIGAVAKDNGVLHLYQNERRIADIPGQLIRRFHQTLPYARDELVGGLLIGETGTRNVTLTAGYLFDRSNRFEISATSTATGGFFDAYYRDSGSGFTAVYNQTQWPNTQYDNGSGTLVTMTANRYSNLWWYLTIDGDVVMLYGRNEFTTIAAAQGATAPATVPPRLQFGAKLIARTTFQKSASTWSANDSTWTTTLNPSAAANHANLTNLDYASANHTGFAGTGLAASQAITYVSSTALSASGAIFADYFIGTGTTSSTLGGSLIMPTGSHTVVDGLVGASSAGIMFHSNNWANVALFGAGGGQGATFYDGVSVTGNLTPATTATSNLGSLSLLWKNFYTTYTSSTISDLGTVLSGVWNGTAITDAYISSASTWNTHAPFAWTPTTNYGALANSTSTPLWFKSAIYASSTARLTSELVIPSSADPTIDKTGELAIDTTVASSSLKYHDGTAERALYDVVYKTFTWSTSTMEAAEGLTSSTTIPIGVSSPQGETWVSLDCFTSAGTVEVEFGDGTNWMDYQKLTTTVSTDTSLSNNTFVMGEKRYARVGRASSLGYGSCSVGIRQNP